MPKNYSCKILAATENRIRVRMGAAFLFRFLLTFSTHKLEAISFCFLVIL